MYFIAQNLNTIRKFVKINHADRGKSLVRNLQGFSGTFKQHTKYFRPINANKCINAPHKVF